MLPRGFARLADVAPGVAQDIRYASDRNFVGRAVEGYAPGASCVLTKPAAEALKRASELLPPGLRLLVWDCYRPERAVRDFVRWAGSEGDASGGGARAKALYYPEHASRKELFRLGYVADRRSGHSRGSTVDLTVEGLDMGTGFDEFTERSHTASHLVSPEARANRALLLRVMLAAGFVNYEREWWHFTLEREPFPDTYFDFPVT